LFWITSVLLITLAALFVAVPLWRQQREQETYGQVERNAANLAIFEERLAELQTEYDEGAFDSEQFEALKHELERSLLSDVDESKSQTARSDSSRFSASKLIPAAIVVLLLPASLVFYEMWGFRDDLHFRELVERSRTAQGDAQEMMALVYAFGEIVESDRENGWAWYFMGRNLTELGQVEDAAMAFERASRHIENEMDRAFVLGQYAQLQYLLADRQIAPAVEETIARAQRINPYEQSVLQLLSTDAWLREDYQGAITYWQQMLTLNPSREDEVFLRSAIAQAREMLDQQGGPPATAADGPAVVIELALAPGLQLTPETRVFVSAQASGRQGPPLAATALSVGDLPARVTLSDAEAVGPDAISSAEAVTIVATASLSGTANVQSGDFQARLEDVRHEGGKVEVRLEIGEEVP
jgi:cytochrome c-type biogenesis protein CcmH